MGEGVHEYGAKTSKLPVQDSDRVGPTVEDALRAALGLLKVFPIATVVRFDPAQSTLRVAATVDLYRIRVGSVLPVGVGDVAQDVRVVLSDGFDGWSMPALSSDPEPMQTCEDHLPIKVVNLLRRHEFRTVEEVALVPDEALLEMGGMGPKLLGRLRDVIPSARPSREHAGTDHGSATHRSRDSTGWVGASALLHRMGRLTMDLADDDPAARTRVGETIAALRAELASFTATNLDSSGAAGDGQSEESAVWCGNAADDGVGHRGWFIGYFLAAAAGARASEDVELKWGQHTRGEHRDDWAPGDRRSSLTLLVSGGPWRVQLPEREYTLTRPGDYLLFGPGMAHTWQAGGDTIILTIRWPSRP